MPKGKEGPSIKKPDTYEALRDKGMSKERAAKISNAQANKQSKGKAKKTTKLDRQRWIGAKRPRACRHAARGAPNQ